MITLQFGINITSVSPVKLESMELTELIQVVKEPLYDLDKKTEQLRRVGGIDQKAYQNLKKELPYVTCGIFNPPYRKTENFARIHCFILDFDHLSSKETNPEELKKQLKTDERVVCMFTSPGGDGLKLLFALKHPFTDHGKYSLFYKVFAEGFARSHGLLQVIDKRTSDAARATFLCYDPEVWYNPFYDEIDAAQWIDFDSATEIDEAIELGKKQNLEYKETMLSANAETSPADDMPDEILEAIKQKLNPGSKPKKKKNSQYVPEQVIQLEEEIKERCAEVGIELKSTLPIQYGKQFSFEAGNHLAELNVFFGKRGFSVVKSAKSICSADFNEIVYKMVIELIED